MPLNCMTPADDNASRSTRLDQFLRLTAENDARAFERLYQETAPAVYAYALSVLKNRQDAEDVLHDCYVSIYHAAEGYQSQGRPMAWIMTIAKNLCYQTLRQRSRSGEATEEDWSAEYDDLILSVKIVDDVQEAIEHINRYNTGHSEAIVTKDYANARKFLDEVDAAAVYVNASTRFTDGFEFGFGAEIGISTQKLHARGPMGLKELTTTKYVIYGDGQIRE